MNAVHWLSYTQSLVVTFAVLFIATFYTLLSVRRKLHLRDSELSRILVLLATRDDVSDVASVSDVVSLEAKIATIDHAVAALGESQLLMRDTAKTSAIDDAVGLAQQGLGSNDIAKRCAIPQAEAELLVRLHTNQGDQHNRESLQ